ncbi:hypothetical protein BC940DRAFT_315447 [Gongronella butleri]|nr:hypothetical protein BC940DRAFT_315447 [Gongronella butleri]
MKRLLYAVILALVFVLAIAPIARADAPMSADKVQAWTKDKVSAFLQKYNLAYDDRDQTLAEKLAGYQQLAKENANYFGDKVNSFADKAKTRLQSDKEMSEAQIDKVVTDLRHRLRKLELQGELSRDNVEYHLDKWWRQSEKKGATASAKWQQIQDDVKSTFAAQKPTAWYQRIFSAGPAPSSGQSIDRWLDNVRSQLVRAKKLSDEQVNQVIAQLRQAVTIKNLNKVASPHWYERLYHRIEKNAKLSQDQLESVKDDLSKQIDAYKIFAVDYAGDKKDDAMAWLEGIHHHCGKAMDSAYTWYDALLQKLGLQAKTKDKLILNSDGDWKKRFDRYWQSKHLEAYRRLGYSEAQINDMKDYIQRTFTNRHELKQSSKIEQVTDYLKRYMQNARVQTSAQIQNEVNKIKQQLEEWKAKL